MISLAKGMTALLALTLASGALSIAVAGDEPGAQATVAAPPAYYPPAPTYYPPTPATASGTAPVAIESLPLAVNRESAAAPAPQSAKGQTAAAPVAATPDQSKSGLVKTEALKTEALKTEALKTEAPKVEPAKAETAKVEPQRVQPAKPETAKAEAARSEARKSAALDEIEAAPVVRPRTTPSIRRAKQTAAVTRQRVASQQAPPLMPIARCTGLCGRFILIGVGF